MKYYDPHIKRFLDMCFSGLALILFMPILVVVGILIRVDSEGPALFVQTRIGKGMRPFKLYKFRSMTTLPATHQPQFDPGCSSRVTNIGRLLRKTKIDELPELFNILKGDMSIVGPRPEVRRYVEMYPDQFERILTVRPGLSDFASIKYRDEEGVLFSQKNPEEFYVKTILPDKLALAMLYLERISFRTDMKIISNTLKSVIDSRYPKS